MRLITSISEYVTENSFNNAMVLDQLVIKKKTDAQHDWKMR